MSCYCSPSEECFPILTGLADLASGYPDDNIFAVRDFNGKSSIWRNRPEKVISFTLHYDFEIINSPDSVATFDNHQGQV